MRTIVESKPLWATAAKGNKKYWQLRVLSDKADYYLQSEHWVEGGQHVLSTPTQVVAKNIGRSNETTSAEQATLEYNAKLKKQMDQKGYREEGGTNTARPTPMLAHKYLDRVKVNKVTWPMKVQPKFDGARMFSNPKLGLWSRLGNDMLVNGFTDEDRALFISAASMDIILDGEILHADGRQATMEAIKKKRPDFHVGETGLLYYAFDCYIPERPAATFKERYLALIQAGPYFPNGIRVVKTDDVATHEGVQAWQAKYLENGHEGTILRVPNSVYAMGKRSVDLLKYKQFDDDEFKCIDVVEGSGSHEGCAIFVCHTKDGKEFHAPPKGSKAVRAKYWRDRKSLIGKMITVKYQGFSTEWKPWFPVALGVRDYE